MDSQTVAGRADFDTAMQIMAAEYLETRLVAALVSAERPMLSTLLDKLPWGAQNTYRHYILRHGHLDILLQSAAIPCACGNPACECGSQATYDPVRLQHICDWLSAVAKRCIAPVQITVTIYLPGSGMVASDAAEGTGG